MARLAGLASARGGAAAVAALLPLVACGGGGESSGQEGASPRTESGAGRAGAGGGGGGSSTDGTSLHLRVVETKTGEPVPAVVSLWKLPENVPLRFGAAVDPGTPSMGSTVTEIGVGGALAHWHGIALWRGEAVIPVGVDLKIRGDGARSIPFGSYRLVVHRGIEFDLTEARVDLLPGAGAVFVRVPLSRALDTTGYLAADLHVHSAPGSGDSTLSAHDRIKTLVSAGIEVVVASDHDHNSDLGAVIRELWPAVGEGPPPAIAALTGNEASGPGGHFNVFPTVADPAQPRNGAPGPVSPPPRTQAFFDRLHALPGRPMVQLNHTRLNPDIAYFNNPVCGPWGDRARLPPCSLDFEAMEVLNGYLACGGKIGEQIEDWYALLRFGVVVTATGNSDSHGTSNLLGGFPRTFVRVADDRASAFAEDDFVRSLRDHRAVATTGPFLVLRINDRAETGAVIGDSDAVVEASVRMQAASWVTVDEVRLLIDGGVVKSWSVPRVGEATPFFEVRDEKLAISRDAFVTAEATGKRALPAFVVGEWLASTKDQAGYHVCPPASGAEPGMAVFAVTNPVFIDADGDGRYRGVTQPDSFPVPSR